MYPGILTSYTKTFMYPGILTFYIKTFMYPACILHFNITNKTERLIPAVDCWICDYCVHRISDDGSRVPQHVGVIIMNHVT
jgi:hypothetical protein